MRGTRDDSPQPRSDAARSVAAATSEDPRPRLRSALAGLTRFIATPTVAKHRLFVWLTPPTLPDHQLILVTRADAYTFGVLHSRLHDLWTLRMCSRLGLGNDPRYTPTTTFETFPFPWPLDQPPRTDEQRAHQQAIAAAAESLDHLRRQWQGPPDAPTTGRTLTRLYNDRPTWLRDAHVRLDRAVLAAYGWPDAPDDELLARLLALNLERPAAPHPRKPRSSAPGSP